LDVASNRRRSLVVDDRDAVWAALALWRSVVVLDRDGALCTSKAYVVAAGVVIVWPIMGFCVPWIRWLARDQAGLRILTCNVDGENLDVYRFGALVDLAKPDIVAIQECASEMPLVWPKGWNVFRGGQCVIASPYTLSCEEGTYNRHPASRWPAKDAIRCRVATPRGEVAFCCVHLHTPREGLSEVLDRRTIVSPERSGELTAETSNRKLESRDVSQWLRDWPGRRIVAGDFNMPVDSAIFRGSWSDYADAFSTAGFGLGYTKWTPIGGCSYGVRIDHILTNDSMAVQRCWVGPDVGSDHLPLLADVRFVETAEDSGCADRQLRDGSSAMLGLR
jgi:endonuclease/exonuclease/phosphatase (EEP) superfamily protein YafD